MYVEISKVLGLEPSPKKTNEYARKRQSAQEALNAFLVAASALADKGQVVDSELRYQDALRTAEREFGPESDQTMLVSSILAAFYRARNRLEEAALLEARLESWQMPVTQTSQSDPGMLGKPLIKKADQDGLLRKPAMDVPTSLRKSCQILGLSLEGGITIQSVNKAWKDQMLQRSAHPDLGGNADEALLLNKAKEELMAYLESRAPKLGTKFTR